MSYLDRDTQSRRNALFRFFHSHQRGIVWSVWVASAVSLVGLIVASSGYSAATGVPHRGWDAYIYRQAIQSVRTGADPYTAGLDRQLAAQSAGRHAFAYVYPPLTLPILRVLGGLPDGLVGALYWLLYAAGFIAQLWAVTQCFRPNEWTVMRFVVPLAVFFPGLMTGDTILSGNIACIFYGAAFAGAVPGWKRGVWRWFYLAVFLAGCVKLPLLTLLAIPLLVGKQQWRKAAATATACLVLFAAQNWFWPEQFHAYLKTVSLQFQFNSDFGISPAGILGHFLYSRGLPYSNPSLLVFLVYGAVFFAFLYFFSRLFRAGHISVESWIPVVLLGAVLLNPRIMHYDVQPLTLPMALILVRAVSSRFKWAIALVVAIVFLIILDLAGVGLAGQDNLRDMLVLVCVFAVGSAVVANEARQGERGKHPPVAATVPSNALAEITAQASEPGN